MPLLRLFSYLWNQGVATQTTLFPDLAEGVRGMPKITEEPCASGCQACADGCPTDAIKVFKFDDKGGITLDLGSCINCGLCVEVCPTKTLINNPTTKVAVKERSGLILTNLQKDNEQAKAALTKMKEGLPQASFGPRDPSKDFSWFKRSVAARVVSTGCSACDMEIGAAGNPIFDIERFGISIVASPRFADALIVTGPVPKGMHAALTSCYQAMSSPRVVVALGTCAISGGVHRGGYAETNGVDHILPVDVYIPGCPPHPWMIIHGMHVAMGKEPPAREGL
ncbi:MAG: NADH-quinone oxidoreductase subunit NuoB [Cyanobacteria bacterium SZAS LIN-2]|nr:NADH-quinone oxidoreductase subunit NuoB [Cyanobacteria bacterium SZAS LIN-2]